MNKRHDAQTGILCFVIALMTISQCEEPKESYTSYSISEIYAMHGIDTIACGQALPAENTQYWIRGYIYDSNVFEDDNRLLLFAEEDLEFVAMFNNGLIEVEVMSKADQIFRAIENGLTNDVDGWIEVCVQGEIFGWDLSGIGYCKKQFGIRIDDIDVIS